MNLLEEHAKNFRHLASQHVQQVRVGARDIAVIFLHPFGSLPRPLVIINHGTPGPADGHYSTFVAPSIWFLKKGYAVALPVRRGYGISGGERMDGIGHVAWPDFYNAGLETARDIEATLQYAFSLENIVPSHALVVGQSSGGFGGIALSTKRIRGLDGIVNFAGGRSGLLMHSSEALLEATEKYGSQASIPMLWLYAENDRLFPPEFSQKMFDAYVRNGGIAQYCLLPALRPNGRGVSNGHGVFHSSEGVSLWSELVENFCESSGHYWCGLRSPF